MGSAVSASLNTKKLVALILMCQSAENEMADLIDQDFIEAA